MDFVAKLAQTVSRFSFQDFGLVELKAPLSLGLYMDWLKAGHQADMDYLQRHLPEKADPQLLAPKAHAAIVVTKGYLPHPYPANGLLNLRTALYARGGDYHTKFRSELEDLRRALQVDFPAEEFLCFTDSSPILERDLAARAGLGWVGKNSCLIDRQKGSLFFIGEIFTSMRAPGVEKAMTDFCGTCNRCLTACPTGAFQAPRVLDSNRCISYWTIEAKAAAPEALRAGLGDWFFGCDICQTVCPWNEKVFGREAMRKEAMRTQELDPAALVPELRWLLTQSNKTLARTFAALPYSRARANGLKRNALYVIGNLRLRQLRPEVEALRQSPVHQELAEWTLKQLNG